MREEINLPKIVLSKEEKFDLTIAALSGKKAVIDFWIEQWHKAFTRMNRDIVYCHTINDKNGFFYRFKNFQEDLVEHAFHHLIHFKFTEIKSGLTPALDARIEYFYYKNEYFKIITNCHSWIKTYKIQKILYDEI